MRKILALLTTVISIFILTACVHTNDAPDNKNPTTLVGEWYQVKSNSDGWFSASISGESIQVSLRGRDSSSIFWMGSFDTSHRPTGKFKVVSIPDPDARYTMDHSLMTSNEAKKTFTYNNGELSFEFSALGSSTTIRMRHAKADISPSTKTSGYNQPTPQTPTIRNTPKVVSPPKISSRKK